MSNSTNLTTQKQQPRFSVAITTKTYQDMIANTLRDPRRQKRFVASITSAVAVTPDLRSKHDPRRCPPGRIPQPVSVSPAWPILSGSVQAEGEA